MNLLIYQNYWTPYRSALFSEMAKRVNLKVIYFGEVGSDREWSTGNPDFHYEVFHPRRIGPFLFNKKNDLRMESVDFVVVPEHLENLPAVMRISGIYAEKTILWTGMYDGMNPDRQSYDAVLSLMKRTYRHILYPRVTRFFAYSSMSKAMLRRMGICEDRITIVPQAVESAPISRKHFLELAESRWRPEAPLKILSMGYLRKEKNNIQLIRLASQYSDDELQLIIAGSGPEESRLRSEAGTNVRFTGYLTGDAKKRVLEDADVFILPTLRDPWGLVVNEAMNTGLPVICSSHAGAKDIINGNGFVFNPRDKHKLQNELARYIKDRSILRAMGERSLEIIKDYSISKAADKVLAGLDKALPGGGK